MDINTLLRNFRNTPVYIYTHGVPAPTGSGSRIRHYTNIRAYLDLGFEVEVVHFLDQSREKPSQEPQHGGLDFRWTKVECLPSKPTLFQKVAYQLGFPFKPILDLSFRTRDDIRREVELREEMTPGAIHHFEYLSAANSIIGRRRINTVWSCHDLVSERHAKLFEAREEIGALRKSERSRKLRIKYLERAEKAVASTCNLILMIAKHECRVYREKLGFQHIEVLPMSCPHESRLVRQRDWIEGGKIRLLHLGSIGGLIGYHSLKFLLEEVFPSLSSEVLDKVEMNVVGRIGNSTYSKQIQQLSSHYPQVKLHGYQEDIRPYYQTSDLQVVGSNLATGLRTRIIESFAYGLPVLSTYESARGILDLRPDENVFLVHTAEAFARQLVNLLNHPEYLSYVAEEGRRTYETQYSRSVAAKRLGELLTKYL